MRIACAALAMSFLFGGAVLAADRPAESPVQKTKSRVRQMPFDFLKGVDLTAEQKAKIEALWKEYAPKLKEDPQALENLLTPAQKKARQDAIDAAKAAEQKARELQKAVQTAFQLTPEQKAKRAELAKPIRAAYQELQQKVLNVLTPEQKDELLKARLGMGMEKKEVNRRPGAGAVPSRARVCHCLLASSERVTGDSGTACGKQWHTMARKTEWARPPRRRRARSKIRMTRAIEAGGRHISSRLVLAFCSPQNPLFAGCIPVSVPIPARSASEGVPRSGLNFWLLPAGAALAGASGWYFHRAACGAGTGIHLFSRG